MFVLFEFRHFFIYVFQSFVYIFAKNSERRDVLYYIINGICTDGEQAKAFWLTKVKRRFIGSLDLYDL